MKEASHLPRECLAHLPGAELVLAGLERLDALAAGIPSGTPDAPRHGDAAPEFTVEALLAAVGAPGLRAAGLQVPRAPGWPAKPELALYEAIGRQHPDDAHSRYNALIRRLVSFERAVERLARQRASRHEPDAGG